MNKFDRQILLDKLIVLVFGVFLLFQDGFEREMVLFLLVSFTISLLPLLMKQPKWSLLNLCVLLLLSSQWPAYSYFLPLIIYDTLFDEKLVIPAISSGAVLVFFLISPNYLLIKKVFLLFLCLFSGYLSFRALQEEKLRNNYRKLESDSLEMKFFLENQNKHLLEQQETTIALEISEEQNRIARDIHDNVGHLLSSSLLQVGAIRTINKNEQLELLLNQLQATMDEGMNNIRASVHNLHEESLSLSAAVETMLHHFTFCTVKRLGEIPESISKDYKIAYLMMLKESLANIMKHSNATQVTIAFQTYPGFYKVTITDNGTYNKEKDFNELGIGLTGMKERIEKLSGWLTYYQTDSEFSVRAILPK